MDGRRQLLSPSRARVACVCLAGLQFPGGHFQGETDGKVRHSQRFLLVCWDATENVMLSSQAGELDGVKPSWAALVLFQSCFISSRPRVSLGIIVFIYCSRCHLGSRETFCGKWKSSQLKACGTLKCQGSLECYGKSGHLLSSISAASITLGIVFVLARPSLTPVCNLINVHGGSIHNPSSVS